MAYVLKGPCLLRNEIPDYCNVQALPNLSIPLPCLLTLTWILLWGFLDPTVSTTMSHNCSSYCTHWASQNSFTLEFLMNHHILCKWDEVDSFFSYLYVFHFFLLSLFHLALQGLYWRGVGIVDSPVLFLIFVRFIEFCFFLFPIRMSLVESLS